MYNVFKIQVNIAGTYIRRNMYIVGQFIER